MQLHRPDAERRRRRLRLLAELSGIKVSREATQPGRRGRTGRVRDLIAQRRRLTSTG